MYANTVKIFKDHYITLQAPVFDPQQGNGPAERLKENFEGWLQTTPSFWYEEIKPFRDWIDSIRDWIEGQENRPSKEKVEDSRVGYIEKSNKDFKRAIKIHGSEDEALRVMSEAAGFAIEIGKARDNVGYIHYDVMDALYAAAPWPDVDY